MFRHAGPSYTVRQLVGRSGVQSIAPTRLNRVQADCTILRVLQCEDDEGANRITSIQTSEQEIYRKPKSLSESVGFVGVKESQSQLYFNH
jgi:hypothetical protein